MRVAIQGEPGSNSHLASERILGRQQLVPCTLSAEVFERLAIDHTADVAVLPIENSLHGAVTGHSDLLLDHGVEIHAELSLRIRHALVGIPGSSFEKVRRVLSHPVALSQCRDFFKAHPEIEAVPFYDTAGAVKHIVAQGLPEEAAIAAPYAAEVYGGDIQARDLEDDPQNFTRFLLLGRKGEPPPELPGAGPADRMSLAFDLPHRPGSLASVLNRLASLQADLTRIESRPLPGRPWEYVFFVDLRLPRPETADGILQALASECHNVKELGRYRAAPARNSL